MDPDRENRQEDEIQAEQEQTNEEGQPEEQKAEETEAETTETTNVEERYNQSVDLKNKANEFVKEKKYEEAIASYKSAGLLINPNDIPDQPEGDLKFKLNDLRIALSNNMALCYISMGMYDLALEQAEKVERLDPENIKAIYRIAVCLEKQGKYLEAWEKIDTAFKVSNAKGLEIPNDVFELGERLNLITLSLDERYNHSLHIKNTAKKFVKEKKYEEAIGLYKSAGSLIHPNVIPVQPEVDLQNKLNDLRIALSNKMSHCYLFMGMYDLALEQAEKAERLDPQNIKALYRIAVCLEKQGKYLEAFDKIETALRVSKEKDTKITNDVQEIFERLKGKTKEITEKIQAEEKQTKELPQ